MTSLLLYYFIAELLLLVQIFCTSVLILFFIFIFYSLLSFVSLHGDYYVLDLDSFPVL